MNNMLTEEEASKLQRLRDANPASVALAEQMALKGSTLEAIAATSGLGIAPINRILAQAAPPSVVEKLMASTLATQIPVGTTITYGFIRGLAHGRRESRLVQVADGTTRLREALVNRAVTMVEQGAVVSWRDLMSGLRTIGVPTAGSVTDIDKQANVKPQQYTVGDDGKLVENPAYLQWVTKKDSAQAQQVNLVIGLDLLAQGGTAPLGAKPLETDSDGNVVALQSQQGSQSLVSMEAADLHQMAYGRGSTLKHMKAKPVINMEDLL